MGDPIYITTDATEKLKVELTHLKGAERESLRIRLQNAISQGDLSENADYHKAKEDQAFLEGRIQELEYILKTAVVVEKSDKVHEQVEIGAQVTIQEEDFPEEIYLIVGAKEADPRNGKISNESPIGKALMGARIGDNVNAKTPGGEIRLKILKVE